MSESSDVRKWCAVLKLEGYTTPASAEALVQKFHEIVESFQDAGADLDVFMLLEVEKKEPSQRRPVARKPARVEDG